MNYQRYVTHPPWDRNKKRQGMTIALQTLQKTLGQLPHTMHYIYGRPADARLFNFVSGQLRYHIHYYTPEVYKTIVSNNYGEIHIIVRDGVIYDIRDVPYDYTIYEPSL